MIFLGQDAIQFLSSKATERDSGTSSHWEKYHSEFEFSGYGFHGLRGFGGCQKPYRGIRAFAHQFFQARYRKLASDWKTFTAVDEIDKKILTRQNRAYNLDVLRQSLTVVFLKTKIPEKLTSNTTTCVIGDGFATMASLLLACGAVRRVVLINLTKTLLVDLWYLRLWMDDERFSKSVCLLTDEKELEVALSEDIEGKQLEVIAIEASNHELIQHCPIDLVINIASMQEMNPPVIVAYFDDIRTVAKKRDVDFYCCNRENKTLPDGTVTNFFKYPWAPKDDIKVDELCPWHQDFYILRPPFYQPYDGPIRHRLARISGNRRYE